MPTPDQSRPARSDDLEATPPEAENAPSAGNGPAPDHAAGGSAMPDSAEMARAAQSPEFGRLLDYLHEGRGFDFRGYKPTSLIRRIRRRLAALGIEGFAAYQDYLEVHPGEFAELFDAILINVTQFFRDPEAWEVLRTDVLPRIIASKRREEPIRVWSAGCASGEEAYTLAILLAEALGPDEFRDRVKIYATDADDAALAQARHAVYSGRQVEQVPPDLLARYFERHDGHYAFRKEFRRQVIFGRHNLLQDAPISRIDLITCRNVLMYFNADTQAQILQRFHFALNDGGYLFLGRAETLLAHADIFTAVDLKRRILLKVDPPRGTPRRRPPPAVEAPALAGEPTAGDGRPRQWVRELALDAVPTAVLVTDARGDVVLINERARGLFGLAPDDVGRPLQDLKVSYRPVELRSVVEQATIERHPVCLRDIEWQVAPGERRWLDVQVVPLADATDAWSGACITYTDVSAARRLHQDLERANQELETAYEELQATNEELETTNEELQSTVEELETTNEELQSTNEELETMNEELQSSGAELQTINDELHQRSEELRESNAFLTSVLASMSGGVAVLDGELRLLAWNRQAEDLWGLRQHEVLGQHLLNLDIGLPVDRLRAPLRACLTGEAERQELVLDAVNRRGRAIQCHVTCTPLRGIDQEIRGAIVLMEGANGAAGT